MELGEFDENGKVDGKEFSEWLDQAMTDIKGASAYRSDKDRPYNGQPQTTFGERGKTIIEGLTFRDAMDCFVAGLLDCCGIEQPELYEIADKATSEDMYDVDLSKIDPLAWWQNMACRIEKMMGIYPNVPFLKGE